MKPKFTRFLVLFISLVLCLITCKAPVNNKAETRNDNRWIEEMTISQLQQGYKDGKYKIADIVKVYLDRINEIDKNGPA